MLYIHKTCDIIRKCVYVANVNKQNWIFDN